MTDGVVVDGSAASGVDGRAANGVDGCGSPSMVESNLDVFLLHLVIRSVG